MAPFASIMIAVLSAYFAFTYDVHGAIKLISIVFLGSALLDLIVNLIPNSNPIRLSDGTTTYNDGYLLKQLFQYKNLPKDYITANSLYHEKKYEEAYLMAKNLTGRKKNRKEILRLAAATAMCTQRYEEAVRFFEQMQGIEMDADDYGQLGTTYGFLGDKEKSLKAFDKSLEVDPNNIYSLNNPGYLLVWWNRFDEAIADLTKVLVLNPEYYYAYNNLGLAKIMQGDVENGLADINKSLESDPNNSYAIRNLGIYHLNEGRIQLALEHFTKAKELDTNTHLIESLIEEALATHTSTRNSYPQWQTLKK